MLGRAPTAHDIFSVTGLTDFGVLRFFGLPVTTGIQKLSTQSALRTRRGPIPSTRHAETGGFEWSAYSPSASAGCYAIFAGQRRNWQRWRKNWSWLVCSPKLW